MADIIALIGYSSIQQKNQTRLVFFAKNQQQTLPLNHSGDLLNAIETMLAFDLPNTEADFHSLNQYLAQQKKSLVFILSDFYHQHDYSSIAAKNQVYALMVRDPLEEKPDFGTTLNLINGQHNTVIEADMDTKLARRYQMQLAVEDAKLYAHFAAHKIDFGKLYTHDDAFIRLSQILK